MWLDRLHAERDNVRAAIGFAVAAGDADERADAVRQHAGATGSGAATCAEGRELIDGRAGARRRAARRCASGRSTRAGALAGEQGDFPAATRLFEESLALARELGDDYRVARVEGNLASMALYARDYDEAIERYERSTAYFRSRRRAARR